MNLVCGIVSKIHIFLVAFFVEKILHLVIVFEPLSNPAANYPVVDVSTSGPAAVLRILHPAERWSMVRQRAPDGATR